MNSQQWTPNFRRPASPAVATMMPLETLPGADVYGPPAMPGPSGHGGYRMLYVEAQDGYGPPPAAWLPPVAAAPAYEAPTPGAARGGIFGGMSLRTAGFIFGMLLGIVLFAIL